MLTCNIGKKERGLRVVLGIALIVGAFVVSGSAGIAMGVIGLIPLLSGVSGNCPAYTLFHIDRCHPKGHH